MNVNSGKTGIIDIPAPLHSTGGDGDGQVGNVVAYTGDIWDDTIQKNQREINATLSARTNSLQEIVTELQSSSGGGITSWEQIENFEDTPYIYDSYDITEIALEKAGLHSDDNGNFISFVQNGHNDSYTPNGLSGTSNSALIGKLNSITNSNNSILLGNGNTTDGKKNSDNYDSTVIIGKSNNNSSNNSVLIGDYNDNNQDKSVMLGSSNINKASHGINIGYYNQNNGGESTVLIGDDNSASNSANTICLGSANRITNFYGDQTNQEILAFGKSLYARTAGIYLGYYNADDYVLTGDTANYLTIGNGSDTNHRSNIIEQRRNGDIYILGIGNYDGTNSRQGNVEDPVLSLQNVLNGHEAQIQSAIKLNEYDEVNVTHPLSEEHEAQILCNLTKDDEKIIQDHSNWGSEFADYVRNNHFYIATNMGITGVGVLGDEFDGYIDGEEIVNVNDSSDNSTIVYCSKSAHDYWLLQTNSELALSNNSLYYAVGTYHQTRNFTPFNLKEDGSLYLMNVGGYNGDESITYESQSIQEVIAELEEQIASGSSSGGSVFVSSDSDWVNEVLPGAILVSGVTITAKWIADPTRSDYKWLGFEADQQVDWSLIDIDVYDYNTSYHYNRYKTSPQRVVNGCLMTELMLLNTLQGNENGVSAQEIVIHAKPSFGYSYAVDYDESIANQMDDNDGLWWIDNSGIISY